ncbi:MAG: lipopolysaccharide biosynthesis protein, partial [Flavobacteriales bacterium]
MGVVRRQSIKILIVYGIGVVVSYFQMLWLLPYCLSTEEIGLVRVIQSASMLLGVFIPMGAQKVLLRFFPFFKHEEKGHSGLLPFTLAIPFFGALLWGGLLFLFKDVFVQLYQERSPLFVDHFFYVLPIAAAIAYHKVFISYGRSLLKAVIPNFFQSVMLRIFTSLAVIFYFFELTDRSGMVQGYLLAYLGVAILLLAYCYGIDRGEGMRTRSRIPMGRIKEMLRFGLYMTFTSAGGILMRTIDDLMVGSMVGLSGAGIYSIAFLIGVVIELPKRAVIQTLSPLIAKARKEDDKEKIDDLYKRSSINNLLLGGLFFLGVWMNLEDLFRIMPKGEQFARAQEVVLFIALSKLFGITVGMGSEILMTSKWYRVNFLSMLGTVPVIVILNLILIPVLGIQGAALATFLASLLLNLTRSGFIWVKEGIQPFSMNSLWAVILMAGVYSLVFFLPMPGNALLAIIVRSLTILLLFAVPA